MIGLEMREFSDDESGKYNGQQYSEDEIKQYVEDRDIISGPRRSVHLWEFLLELLMDPSYEAMIQWTDELNGEFKLKNSEDVARKWGQRKHKEGMNYDKLSRALRYYYSKNIIKKVSGRRFVYKFVPSAEMQGAVNAIKAHMMRNGIKTIPAGPFPHIQNREIPNGLHTPQEAKQFLFYPMPPEPSSPRYGAAHSVITTCHSPVRSRSPHRYESEKRENEDNHIPHNYKLDLNIKSKIFERREQSRYHAQMEHIHRRHHSERDFRQHEREREGYRLPSPTDHFPERKMDNPFQQLTNGRHRSTSNYTSYASVFGPLCEEREKTDHYLRKREELLRQAVKYKPVEEVKSGFIDLSATRPHSLPLQKEVLQEQEKHTEKHQSQSVSPKHHRIRDIEHSRTTHHERRHSSSLYETQHHRSTLHEPSFKPFVPYESSRPTAETPYCYMYRRYAPMVNVSTQTQTESNITNERKIWTTRDLDPQSDKVVTTYLNRPNINRQTTSPVFPNRSPSRRSLSPVFTNNRFSPSQRSISPSYPNVRSITYTNGIIPDITGIKRDNSPDITDANRPEKHRTPSTGSCSPLNVKDSLSEGSPDVFSNIENNSPISTPKLITQQLIPTSAPQHCKCGCMEKDSILTTEANASTTGTVVVYPKEVY